MQKGTLNLSEAYHVLIMYTEVQSHILQCVGNLHTFIRIVKSIKYSIVHCLRYWSRYLGLEIYIICGQREWKNNKSMDSLNNSAHKDVTFSSLMQLIWSIVTFSWFDSDQIVHLSYLRPQVVPLFHSIYMVMSWSTQYSFSDRYVNRCGDS